MSFLLNKGREQKLQLLGESKEDLIPVKIFCTKSSRVAFSEDDIKRVAYKPFSAKKPLKADINFFSSFPKDVSQYITPLQSLSRELRPLKKMEFQKKGTQIKWSVDEEDVPSTGTLSYHIMLAFLSGLKDTDGKSAIWLLISQILQLLGKDELVKMKGSTSHVTSYYFWTGILGSLWLTWLVTFAQNTLQVKSL